MGGLTATVIVPAHQEAAAIGQVIENLLADARPGEFDVVVVANGCTDGTASRARAVKHPDVRVVELARGNKVAALNEGDRLARHATRVYLDGDVLLSTADLRRLVGAVTAGPLLAASADFLYRDGNAPALVRSYLRVWAQLPNVRGGLVGAGVYAMGRVGRARFGVFPDVLADDRFVSELFVPSERGRVAGTCTIVDAPGSTRELLARRRRVSAGNDQLARAGLGARDRWGPLRVVRREPARAADLPAFVAVVLLGRLLAARAERAGRVGWHVGGADVPA